MRPVLVLPGIGNSGPAHWQSLWERQHPGVERVLQQDWDNPVCAQWIHSLELAVQAHGPRSILVAHSLACLLVAHWAAQTRLTLHAALLVAVPDPAGPQFPPQASGFDHVPQAPLPFETAMISSTNDPYATTQYAAHTAARWGARHINAGAVGHINAASNLGDWPAGWSIVQAWRES
ncbi:MAG: RBBP9/YdeN family alpha/beta hydrolase [Burkholderiaceae bacterium]